jgi:TDG/mug DNA glycosylase family protein
VERTTVERYESHGRQWADKREPVRRADALAFAQRIPEGVVRADVGAGAGRYTNELGEPVVALDAAMTMLRLLVEKVPRARPVQADIEALPLRRGAIGGSWANMAYQHLPRSRVPLALGELHRAMSVGSPLDIQVTHGDYEGSALPGDDIGGRFFAGWRRQSLIDVVVGAGFEVEHAEVEGDVVRVAAHRARTLADTVGSGMRMLVCGLNPSIYSADRGIGFARPGNRFWPAMIDAGLVERLRDPLHALVRHRIGMTDLCKRATVSSSELSKDEYREGAGRVERMVRWLQPEVVCFVGLEGWRAAVDAKAVAGYQPVAFGGRPTYVMGSTSGLNAHSRLAELADHFRTAAAGPRNAR